jgi:uncharacterized Zn-finger protein
VNQVHIHKPGTGDKPANAQQRYEVTRKDLPLHCPMDGMTLWNSHPRVFLPIEESGEERCPYCGAVYVLKQD